MGNKYGLLEPKEAKDEINKMFEGLKRGLEIIAELKEEDAKGNPTLEQIIRFYKTACIAMIPVISYTGQYKDIQNQIKTIKQFRANSLNISRAFKTLVSLYKIKAEKATSEKTDSEKRTSQMIKTYIKLLETDIYNKILHLFDVDETERDGVIANQNKLYNYGRSPEKGGTKEEYAKRTLRIKKMKSIYEELLRTIEPVPTEDLIEKKIKEFDNMAFIDRISEIRARLFVRKDNNLRDLVLQPDIEAIKVRTNGKQSNILYLFGRGEYRYSFPIVSWHLGNVAKEGGILGQKVDSDHTFSEEEASRFFATSQSNAELLHIWREHSEEKISESFPNMSLANKALRFQRTVILLRKLKKKEDLSKEGERKRDSLNSIANKYKKGLQTPGMVAFSSSRLFKTLGFDKIESLLFAKKEPKKDVEV